MRYERVFLDAIGYELAPVSVTSEELEDRLAPLYQKLHLRPGQLEALTGIAERRWWEPDTPLATGATAAAQKALAESTVEPEQLEVLLYAGVCRDSFEPATACAVAGQIGVHPGAAVYDISNACLGVMNGILDIANRIELGQIRAGMVVTAETSREIVEVTLARLLTDPTMENYTRCLATLTGGSGAAAVLLTDGSFDGAGGHRLRGGMVQTAPEHHKLCRWGLAGAPTLHREQALPMQMDTDSVGVLRFGVELGVRTWNAFLAEMAWSNADVDRVICHQVGGPHKETVLARIGIPEEKDFSTYSFLGNIGTVSLPITAAIAEEREALHGGHKVAFLGIGSGLNCLMLGLEW
ncbi:MAG: 3-oxoacyl-ACP synthase III [Planctomycetota bacterium]